ncbi:hypothetical protein C0Z18_01755 [Trinickia dabaoshanensis]|uniref:Lipopolysaccharide N-acetylglucosaminyl transferase n=1 Tax=Trinickia dabaoshanensis TaxID=564714 RepID=A0A2N7W3C6_9BURK|nr:hypothetical protein [Trinickia dabaoshanensis]PMS23904.1 hypothetical protein C0Z18_01755 [Trinickia dabaoshanensis]
MLDNRERLITGLALAGAALLQAAAIVGALHAGRFADPLVALLVLQAIVAAAEAVAFRRLLPLELREPRRTVLLHLWLASMLVPCVGGLIEVLAAAWGKWVPMRRSLRDPGIVGRPEFVSYLVSRVAHGGGARVQSRLVNTRAATSDRLAALVAIQGLPTHTTGALLRELLADPVDDLRLLAYGTLDQAENEIVRKISDSKEALRLTASDDERRALHRRLAELHFELVYQQLAQGDVYQHTLKQADGHARQAQALPGGEHDAALWLLRARLALAQHRPDAAAPLLERASELGFPRERLLPWLAEAAFLQGHHARTAELAAALAHGSAAPALKPALDYWTS